MTVRPLRDKLIVRPSEPETRTQGGLVIPETARDSKKSTCKGTVVSVADGWDCPNPKCDACLEMDIKPGDIVHYARHATRNERIVDGEVIHLLRYEHVLAVEEA